MLRIKNNKNKKSAFTLIELLVVIAIIGILVTLAVVALQNARKNARDAKRIADIKQIQTALELYFNDVGEYPAEVTSTISYGSNIYIATYPSAPNPADGECEDEDNVYTYTQQSSGASYTIDFCLGGPTADLIAGIKQAVPSGIIDPPPPPVPWACGDTLIDSRDSNEYETVEIGTQCLMAKDLNYDNGCSAETWINSTDVGWCGCYLNNSVNCDNYGRLYQWSAVMDVVPSNGNQGICPEGWHIPTNSEWEELMTYLGGYGYAGGKMKSTRTDPEGHPRWDSPNTGATNSSGFNALPGGSRFVFGNYSNIGINSFYWSSSLGVGSTQLINSGESFGVSDSSEMFKPMAYSVRCIKD